MTHKITTTMQPTVQIEVDDAEYLDLKRQGLIAQDDAGHAETSSDVPAAVENAAASAPATPDQAQAPAPAATSKAAKTAANKEG
ncbi:hypothetical protein ACH4UM_23915 [Streptomyces sp. NPDC020801]|uniref:hypothetical protein n=1 Tax=Streptomyces sp. NPDC020801 TaxID=3365093 RepID=UPI0037BB61F2